VAEVDSKAHVVVGVVVQVQKEDVEEVVVVVAVQRLLRVIEVL